MTRFSPDKATYLRSHAVMAALAMAGGMIILWLVGNPHVWTGAIGGLAAVALRGWYLMDEDLAAHWHMSNRALSGPAERHVLLHDIDKLRPIGTAVQIITRTGDKHLIKYQVDPSSVINRIQAARGAGDPLVAG